MMSFVSKKIGEGYDYVIMGHRHEPIEKEFGHGTYINLGDWITHNTYAVMNGGRVTLKEWGASNRSGHGRTDA